MELEIILEIKNKDICEEIEVNNLIIYKNAFILVNTVKSNQSKFSKSMGNLHCQRKKRNIFTNKVLANDEINSWKGKLVAIIRKKNSKQNIKIKFDQFCFSKYGLELSFNTETKYLVATTNIGNNFDFKKGVLFDQCDLRIVISNKDYIINIYESL